MLKEICNEPIALVLLGGITTWLVLGIYIPVSQDHNSYDPKTLKTIFLAGCLLTFVLILRALSCSSGVSNDDNVRRMGVV